MNPLLSSLRKLKAVELLKWLRLSMTIPDVTIAAKLGLKTFSKHQPLACNLNKEVGLDNMSVVM